MNAWRCDRCKAVSTDGNVDDLPDNWRHIHLPVRIDAPVRPPQIVRSTRLAVICDECDEDLYEWANS